MARKAYPTDLTSIEREIIKPYLPAEVSGGRGRPRIRIWLEILDAIFSILRIGCAWRLLPHDFPPWQTSVPLFPYLATRWNDGETPYCSSAKNESLSEKSLRGHISIVGPPPLFG